MFEKTAKFVCFTLKKKIRLYNIPSQHARAGLLRVKCGQCGLVRASQNRKGSVQVLCSFHEGKVQFSSGLSSIVDVCRNRAVPVQFGK